MFLLLQVSPLLDFPYVLYITKNLAQSEAAVLFIVSFGKDYSNKEKIEAFFARFV
jgi:hypothetical protein